MRTTAIVAALWLAASCNGAWAQSPDPPRRIFGGILDMFRVLPPIEWDHEFEGNMLLFPEVSAQWLRLICGLTTDDAPRRIHGCAVKTKPDECRIYLLEKKEVEKLYPMEWLIRHERAHCNGWKHNAPRVIDPWEGL